MTSSFWASRPRQGRLHGVVHAHVGERGHQRHISQTCRLSPPKMGTPGVSFGKNTKAILKAAALSPASDRTNELGDLNGNERLVTGERLDIYGLVATNCFFVCPSISLGFFPPLGGFLRGQDIHALALPAHVGSGQRLVEDTQILPSELVPALAHGARRNRKRTEKEAPFFSGPPKPKLAVAQLSHQRGFP